MRKCLQADALDHKQIDCRVNIDLLKCKLLRTYHKTQPIKRQISTILAASVQTCCWWEILTCEHFNEWNFPSTHLFMFHRNITQRENFDEKTEKLTPVWPNF